MWVAVEEALFQCHVEPRVDHAQGEVLTQGRRDARQGGAGERRARRELHHQHGVAGVREQHLGHGDAALGEQGAQAFAGGGLAQVVLLLAAGARDLLIE